MSFVLIGLAGGAGSLLRHGLTLLCAAHLGAAVPYGTFLVNVCGSFALGAVSQLGAGREVLGVELRLVLGVGALGGFTTYSSFNLEMLRMWEDGAASRAAAYGGATVVACLAAGLGGMALARALGART